MVISHSQCYDPLAAITMQNLLWKLVTRRMQVRQPIWEGCNERFSLSVFLKKYIYLNDKEAVEQQASRDLEADATL